MSPRPRKRFRADRRCVPLKTKPAAGSPAHV